MKLIFEKSQKGRRAGTLPSYDLPPAEVPEELRRREAPRLPELAEPEIVRHFTALADRTFGVDTGPASGAAPCPIRVVPSCG